MKILGLTIENLRKIKCAQLNLTELGNLVQIRGRNEAGKSTILLAAEILLGGASFIPGDVIKHGEDSAQIMGQIGDYEVRRVIKNNGNQYLTILKEGMKQTKPQEFLNTLSGCFLDPVKFSELSGPEKKKILMHHLDIDFTSHNIKIGELEIDRRVKGREIKGLGTPKILGKIEKVNIGELLKQREEIDSFNKIQDDLSNKKSSLINTLRELNIKERDLNCEIAESVKTHNSELARLKAEYEEAVKRTKSNFSKKSDSFNQNLANLISEKNKINSEHNNIPEPKSKKETDSINEQILNAEITNQKAKEWEDNESLKAEIELKTQEYNNLTTQINQIKAKKEDILKNAQMPIKGLTITDIGLSFQDITDENWSDSEGLKIAMHVSAALSKQLKTIFIKRGESLDTASLAEIKAFAEENDYQVIMEIVDDSYAKKGDGIIYIEEGKVI